jgi:L-amino acid N-acyltransferase
MTDKQKTGKINIRRVSFREARSRDLVQIQEIMAYYINKTNFIWSYSVADHKSLKKWLKEHQAKKLPVQVALYKRKVIGYSCLSDFRPHDGYWPCAENSVYVDPSILGSGVGSLLLQRLFDLAETRKLKAIIAVIDSENTASIAFHEKHGFKITGQLEQIGWKNDSWRSAVLLQFKMRRVR